MTVPTPSATAAPSPAPGPTPTSTSAPTATAAPLPAPSPTPVAPPTWLDRLKEGAGAAVETAEHYVTAAARTAAPVIATVQEKAAPIVASVQEKASELGQRVSEAWQGDDAAKNVLKRLVAAHDALTIAKHYPEDRARVAAAYDAMAEAWKAAREVVKDEGA